MDTREARRATTDSINNVIRIVCEAADVSKNDFLRARTKIIHVRKVCAYVLIEQFPKDKNLKQEFCAVTGFSLVSLNGWIDSAKIRMHFHQDELYLQLYRQVTKALREQEKKIKRSD